MKKFFLFVIWTSLTTFASSVSVDFKQFSKAALEAQETLSSTGDDCNFSVSKTTKGIKLFIGSDRGNIFMHVPANSKIYLDSKTKSDGSYVKFYSIAGVGSVRFTHSTDSHFRVDLKSSLVNQTQECTIEY